MSGLVPGEPPVGPSGRGSVGNALNSPYTSFPQPNTDEKRKRIGAAERLFPFFTYWLHFPAITAMLAECGLEGLARQDDRIDTMLRVNMEKSGLVSGVGVDKLKIIIDGEGREEVDSQPCRDLARKTATQHGFGSGGMCDNPVIGPVGPDGDMLEGMAAIKAGAEVVGFRAEYLFATRV